MKLSPKVTQSLVKILGLVGKYKVILFIVIVAAVYGHVLLNIENLSTAQPSTSSVSTELSTVRPTKIDTTVVKQLNQLQDNNVNVKALFDDARQNPFQECKSQNNSVNSDPSC